MADLSVKLDRIEKAVDRIRVKVKKPTEAIEEVATAVEEMGAGTGEQDIYKVASVEERDTIQAKENDMCVIYGAKEFNYEGSQTSNILLLPGTIVVENPITANATTYLYYGSTNQERLMFQLSATYYRIRDYKTMTYLAQYTSTDGKTYTKTSGEEQVVYESDFRPYTSFNASLTPFIFMKGVAFDGMFTYKNATWVNTDIGISTDEYQILPNYKAYTNAGVITGSFPELSNDGVKKLANAMESIKSYSPTDLSSLFSKSTVLEPMVYETLLKLIFNSSITIVSSMFSGCEVQGELNLYDLDFSNVEKMYYTFQNMTNITKVVLPHKMPTNLVGAEFMFAGSKTVEYVDASALTVKAETYLTSLFANCTSLKHIDLRSLDFSILDSVPSNMFAGIPTDCLIIVKNSASKSYINRNYSTLTNVKTVAEYGA